MFLNDDTPLTEEMLEALTDPTPRWALSKWGFKLPKYDPKEIWVWFGMDGNFGLELDDDLFVIGPFPMFLGRLREICVALGVHEQLEKKERALKYSNKGV